MCVVFQSAFLKSFMVNERLIDLQPNTMYLSQKCCNRNELFPFIPLNDVNFNITITRNTVVVDINFKNMNFKNLTKMLLVLTSDL